MSSELVSDWAEATRRTQTGEPEDGNEGLVENVLDVPADAVNATLGTGHNLGWFGAIDRNLDYRVLTGEMDADSDEWAEPSPATTGLSGAGAAVSQQADAAGEDASDAAKWATPDWMDWFIENPWLTALLLGGGYMVMLRSVLNSDAGEAAAEAATPV